MMPDLTPGLEQKTRVWSISTRSQGAHMHCYGESRSSLLDLNMCLILLSPCRLLSSGIFFSIYNTETMATQHLPTFRVRYSSLFLSPNSESLVEALIGQVLIPGSISYGQGT